MKSDRDFWGVLTLINKHGGVENFRCFAQLPMVEMRCTPFGLSITGDKYSWVECKINENRYRVDDGYKISLEPLDTIHFTWEHYEQSDFMKLFERGSILVKTKEEQSVQHITMAEYLCGSVYIIHEADIVVDNGVAYV
jgi:hypothetical protein